MFLEYRAGCGLRQQPSAAAQGLEARIIGRRSSPDSPTADNHVGRFSRRINMSVTVDLEPLAAEELGLQTVGAVLSHLQRENRLVVNLLIDGQQPDLSAMSQLRQSSVLGRTLFIETANPRQMAREVLDEVEQQLQQADQFKSEAADLLQQNQVAKAMEKLGVCFTTWQAAQESVLKTGQLLRIDLERLRVGGQSLVEILSEFSGQLRQIKDTLMDRDFVLLSDILLYETAQASKRWEEVLNAMRDVIGN